MSGVRKLHGTPVKKVTPDAARNDAASINAHHRVACMCPKQESVSF
jgi:hypothetical protein